MKATILENGDLKLTVDNQEQNQLLELQTEDEIRFDTDDFMHEWFEDFTANNEYDWANAEDFGCLTSAPLLSDGKDVWGFMNYQIYSVQSQLLDYGEVTFTKG